jgi:hypothetical protein
MNAAMRELSDLRVSTAAAERELKLLRQEQQKLDQFIAQARRSQKETPSRRFVRGCALGVMSVMLVWGTVRLFSAK